MEKSVKAVPYLISDEHDNCHLQKIGPIIGTVKKIDDDGRVFVDFSGNSSDQLTAALAISKSDMISLYNSDSNVRVLILFENNDIRRPVITGLIKEIIDSQIEKEVKLEPIEKLLIDGQKHVIKANEEIILCCGKSSITLKKNGKIILRGTDLVSRSSGSNKIRGASVKIN